MNSYYRPLHNRRRLLPLRLSFFMALVCRWALVHSTTTKDHPLFTDTIKNNNKSCLTASCKNPNQEEDNICVAKASSTRSKKPQDDTHLNISDIQMIEQDNANDICRYYMATSSIPNAGWGIYTAVDIAEDDTVFQPEIVIPLMDVNVHNGEDFFWMPDSYTWQANTPGVEYEAHAVDAFIPGPGALPNYHTKLINLVLSRPSIYNDSGLHRSEDPGAGAISYHTYNDILAVNNITAGAELFIDYGEHWFKDRVHEFGYIPMAIDYKTVDVMLQRFINLKSGISGMLSSTAISDLWDLTKQISSLKPQTLNAYKITNYVNLDKILEIGTARYSLPNSERNVTWVHENGLCIDYLHPAKSNIPQAGKGAFVSQFFSKGDIVAPVPLIHIAYNTTAQIYNFSNIDAKNDTIRDVVGKQLLLNYCYSHMYSTVLLCPYGSVVNFVNHNSKTPNIKIRWSTFKGTHNEWLNISVGELEEHKKAGLMFEFVAIRDISPGEEILLDYGREWEEAWNKHVREFAPLPGSNNYTSAFQIPNLEWIRTEKEQVTGPYPSNVAMFCIYRNVWRKKIPQFKCEIFSRPFLSDEKARGTLTPCRIVQRSIIEGNDYYTAYMSNARDASNEYLIPNDHIHQVSSIPRDSIVLKDKYYSSDLHLKNAFRHPIGISDDVFPTAWMNLKME